MTPQSRALAVITTLPEKRRGAPFFDEQGKLLAARIRRQRKGAYEGALNALCIGMLLWQTKAALKSDGIKRGFQAWVAEHIPDLAERTYREYMALSKEFALESNLLPEEALAMAALDPEGAKTEDEKSAVAKMDGFIGDLSVFELMIKHGVRGVGLKSQLTSSEAPPALTAGEQMDLIWSQAYEPAKFLADLLVERAATLAPERRDAIAAELNRALQALRAC